MAVDHTVKGDLRFLGHRDMLRLFARATVRARLPLRYSEGFNPHPRLSLPWPRPVGAASDAERLVIELTGPVEPDLLRQRLQEQLPEGIRLTRAWTLNGRQGCRPVRVVYQIALPVPDRHAAAVRAAELLGPSPIPFQRIDPKTSKVKPVDLRPFIETIEVAEDAITLTLRILSGATARVAEVVTLLGLEAGPIHHRVRRLEIEWQ